MNALHTALNAARISLYSGNHELALRSLRIALGIANAQSPPHRRPIMRAMNWTRIAMRQPTRRAA